MKFYICGICGNELTLIHDSGNAPYCCGRQMRLLVPESTDGSKEKHVPVISIDAFDCKSTNADAKSPAVRFRKVTVDVGEAPHPMTKDHYIQWIVLETGCGIHIRRLSPDSSPKAVFLLDAGEIILKAYSICNLHGLFERSCDC